MANAQRWADQFAQPDGRSSREVMKTETIEVGGVPVLLSEVTGTYSGGMAMMGGPSQDLEGYMLLGAVAEGPDPSIPRAHRLTSLCASCRSARFASGAWRKTPCAQY